MNRLRFVKNYNHDCYIEKNSMMQLYDKEEIMRIREFGIARDSGIMNVVIVLYVNGEYRGDTELGKLMHDFNCTDADDMNYKLLADKTRYLKENPEGVELMCRSMEEMRNETAIRASIATYRECNIADKTIIERIMVRFNLTLEKATEYVAEKIVL